MNQNEVIQAFAALGWTVRREAGGPACLFDKEDRIASIVPKLKKLTDKEKLVLTPSVTTNSFLNAARAISGKKTISAPLFTDLRINDVAYFERITIADLAEISQKVLDWATSVDLKSEMVRLTKISTDSVGSLPLYHLAALALMKDTAMLENYRMAFASGDRLGFMPYITAEYIDRAYTLAQSESDGE